jgi:hypothetical protein
VIVDTDIFEVYKEFNLTKVKTVKEELGFSATFLNDGEVLLYCMNRFSKVSYYCFDHEKGKFKWRNRVYFKRNFGPNKGYYLSQLR